MIDFLSMLNIEYKEDKDFIDSIITSIIKERELVYEWSSFQYDKIVDIKKMYTDSVSILVRSVMQNKKTLDVRLFIPIAIGDKFTKSENIKVSYNKTHIVAVAYTYSETGGTPINFVVNNVEDYEIAIMQNAKVTGVYLSGFANEAIIVLPIDDRYDDIDDDLDMAVMGSEKFADSVKELDGEDDTYDKYYEEMKLMQELLKTEDVLSVMEVYFFPIENFETMYSVLGMILEVDREYLKDGSGFLYKLKVKSMGIVVDVYVNENQLLGEPKAGMRFKGNIWLQGKIEFV